MKTVPLNSFVILSGASLEDARELFNASEIIDASELSKAISPRVRPLDSSVYAEYVWDLAKLKLRYGERVVLFAPQVSYEDKLLLVNKARKMGFHPIFLCKGSLREYPKCDLSVEVVDLARGVNVINFIGDKNFIPEIKARGFSGITVIPDIHGSMHALRSAVSRARTLGHFMVFLGDLLDYGPEPIQVVDEVYFLVARGEAEVMMGNHERKIHRYLTQIKSCGDSKMKLSEGNLVTLSKLAGLPSGDTTMWVHRFNAFVNMMRHHRIGDSIAFAHAGVSSDMWKTSSFRLNGENESVALFGEVEKDSTSTTALTRAYGWISLIPDGHTAIVGHDNRGGDEPLVVVNENGGKAIFLDTGCGKGGHLSTIDIVFKAEGYEITEPYMH